MGFGAASAIPEMYRQILADEELVGRLAFRVSAHSIDSEDAKGLESEFRSFLVDLAHEKRVVALWEMQGRAGEEEGKIVRSALIMGLDECGEIGQMDGPLELLRKEGLDQKTRRVVERVLAEAMLACSKGGRVSRVLELLDMELLPEKMHEKALEIAGKGTYADYEKFMEKAIGLLEKEGAPSGLKRCAERALIDWAIEECLERADPDDTGALLGLDENGKTTMRQVDKDKLKALVLGLVPNERIHEKVRAKALEAISACEYMDPGKAVDMINDLLGRKGGPHALREAAERALPGPVEECIRMGGTHLGAAAALFRNNGIPWATINRVVEGCAKTGQFTKIVYVFKRRNLPEESAKIAEKALLDSIGFFGEKALAPGAGDEGGCAIGRIVLVLEEKGLTESIYLRAIEVCKQYKKVHGYPFVEALGEMFSRPDATQPVRDAAENALLGGEILECAGAGFAERLEKVRKMPKIPERVKRAIDETLDACRKLREKQGEEARVSVRTAPVSGDQGFVDSRVKPPSSGRKSVAPAESAPVTRIVPANGSKAS